MDYGLALSNNGVDLWLAFINDIRDKELLDRYSALLSFQERDQFSRYYFAEDQQRYLVTRALVRDVLSYYAPIPAKEWRFEPNPYGRPIIQNSHCAAKSISFNISHTNELIILGLTRGPAAIGVDTENLRRDVPLDMADRFFSPKESKALRRLPSSLQPKRFFELWTLKESYIKARSMGLSIPLGKFGFQLDIDNQISIEFDQDFEDVPSRWKFWQWRLSADYLAALCLETTTAYPVTIALRRIIPLLRHEYFVGYEMLRTSTA